MVLAISILAATFLVLMGVLWSWSPGTPPLFVDRHGNTVPGSISEKTLLDINGVNQGMFIKGKDSINPVLLYLHGGMPEYFLTRKYPTPLEEYFTV